MIADSNQYCQILILEMRMRYSGSKLWLLKIFDVDVRSMISWCQQSLGRDDLFSVVTSNKKEKNKQTSHNEGSAEMFWHDNSDAC